MEEQRLDDLGGSNAIGFLGSVRIELWTVERKREEGPIVVVMSPGQAMNLCAKLANASRHALHETTNG